MRSLAGLSTWPLLAGARAGLLFVFLAASPARASQPCMPESMRREHATWVAVGTLVERHEKLVPYPNCALDDRSQCNRWDQSLVVVKVDRYERGDGPGELRLVAEMCAPAPPRETGGRYRFFGDAMSTYAAMEEVRGPLGPEPRLRILAPLPGARLGGKVDVLIRTARFTPCAPVALEVDGEQIGTFDAALTRLPLDTNIRRDGMHALAVSAVGCDGRKERASVDVTFDNLFTFESWFPYRPYFQDGGWVGFEVEYGGDTRGIQVVADFSAMDSGYVKGREQVEPLGGGRFRIGYRLTQGNKFEDGDRPVSVVATSPRGKLARKLDVPLRNVPPSPFDVETRAGRAVEIPDGRLPADLPAGPRVVTVAEGDGETMFPDMPTKIGLRWEKGPREPSWLWVRPAGYRGLHRIALQPGQSEVTIDVTYRGSTPEHRPGPVPGGQPTLDFLLEYEAPRGRKSPLGERISPPTPVRYRIFAPPSNEAEAFPPKGASGRGR